MEAIRSRDSLNLLTKDQKLIFLEQKVAVLSRLEDNIIPFKRICDEAKINYENLMSLSYSVTLISNFKVIDTINVFNAVWNDSIDVQIIDKDKARLYEWLKFKLKADTLVVE